MFRTTITTLATLLLLLAVLTAQPAASAAVALGRVINQDHEKIFAEMEQAQRAKSFKERKPYLACPTGLVPCLANGDAETASNDIYECVDVTTSLQSCGGCSLARNEDGDIQDGQGTDCTTILNVRSVECKASSCVVTSCKAGYRKTSIGCV